MKKKFEFKRSFHGYLGRKGYTGSYSYWTTLSNGQVIARPLLRDLRREAKAAEASINSKPATLTPKTDQNSR